jgi:hypothetical protein
MEQADHQEHQVTAVQAEVLVQVGFRVLLDHQAHLE